MEEGVVWIDGCMMKREWCGLMAVMEGVVWIDGCVMEKYVRMMA